MGKYTFTWEHAASEVYVTGTFDDWRKTVKLEKNDGVFKKTVELPRAHTQYKFVVDGNWCINLSARKEDDGNGIVNNVLEPADIVDEPVHTHSSAAPAATTAALAGAVPRETEKTRSNESLVPGAFPMTPAAETPGSEPQTFNIHPIPATEGAGNPVKLAPGEPVPHPSTFTSNTVHSTVKHDEYDNDNDDEAQAFGVAPLPATAGLGNPIHLTPGEKVPHPSTFTPHTVNSTAKYDPTSYEKSDALPGLPELGLTPQAERDARGGMFGLPPLGGNLIPESSLPMGVAAKTEQDTGVTIQSSAPTSTTAALAGQVPKEPRGVPEIVAESRKEAGFAPEAITNPEAVQEKKEVEQELKSEVPEAPAAADNSYVSQIKSNAGVAAATLAAGATAGAGLFSSAVSSAKDKATDAAAGLNGSATGDSSRSIPSDSNGSALGDVPSIVSQSQKEAHVSPEAATNAEAVSEKSQVEQELLSKLSKTHETGAPAPAIAIPAVVSESLTAAHASPEAAAYSEAVAEKKAVESELLREIPKTNEAGEPAPTFTAATSAIAPSPTTKLQEPALNVPDVVAESQKEAHASPEASANRAAVSEKQAVESELLREIPKTYDAGAPAPVITAATSTSTSAFEPTPFTLISPASNVPDVVAESQKEAHASPEAAASTEAVGEKKAVEAQLLQEVKKTDATGQSAPATSAPSTTAAPVVDSKSDALNAPASAPAQVLSSKPIDANTSVSYAAKEPTTIAQTKPTVTTGTETTTIEPTTQASSSQALETPRKDLRKDSDVSPKGTPGSQSIASGADDKKKKRRSIFGRIKDKISSKN